MNLIGGSGELISLLYCCIIQEFSSSFLRSLFFAFGSKGPLSKGSIWAGALGMEGRTAKGLRARRPDSRELVAWPHPCSAASSLDGVSPAADLFGHRFPSSSMRRHNWVRGGTTGSVPPKACSPERCLLRRFFKKMVLWPKRLQETLCMSLASLSV